MKKRISTRAICLLVAAVMLVGALTVSAINGSPYENLKNAVIDALFYENFTMEGEFTLRVDGHIHSRAWTRHYYGDESRLETSGNESHRLPGDTRPAHSTENTNYHTRYFRINPVFTGGYGIQWYTVNWPWHNPNSALPQSTFPQSIGYEMFGQAGRSSNYLRLAELVVDLFVGDLKNNLTMNSQGDGITRISGAITESQLPEFVRIIIDIAIDEQLRWRDTQTLQREDFVDVMDIPMRSITIDRVQGHADIDENGNLLNINVLGTATTETIFGDTHVIEIEGTMNFTDIGTTMPESPFAGANEIFHEHFNMLRERQMSNRQLFFTLDENGNINVDSITDQWPRWTHQESHDLIYRYNRGL